MSTTIESHAAALAAQWEAAWNAHDMRRLRELVTDDADWVTVAGVRLQGRDEIERVHAALHGTQFQDSVWTNDAVNVTALAPTVALLHLAWRVRGDRDADGTPRQPRHGLFSWVLVDSGGRWRIRAAHNTNAA